MSKWVKAADKINRTMQSAAGIATKDAQTNTPGQNYALNSYAFHSRQLINTLSTFLPAGFDKSKVESIFVEISTNDNMHHPEFLLFSENTDKIRKRVLISSTFATAYRTKHVFKIFEGLRNCKANQAQLFKRSQAAIANSNSNAVVQQLAALTLQSQHSLVKCDLQNMQLPPHAASLPYQ